MHLLDLVKPEKVIHELSSKAIDEGLALGLDLARVKFDLYVTLIYQGFLSSEQMTFHTVLDLVPFEYLPCPKEQAPSFYVTTATIDRTVKKYRDFVLNNIKLDAGSLLSIASVVNKLPLSHTEVNQLLLESGVIPHPVSTRAIEFLFTLHNDSIDNGGVKSVNLYISSKNFRSDGTRYERNTRPSYVVFALASKEKRVKAISTVIIRTAEIVSGLIGFVHSRHVALIVHDRHKTKVNALFESYDHLEDFIKVFITSRYKDAPIQIDDNKALIAVSDEINESDINHSLEHYLSMTGQLALDKFPEYVERLLTYKEVLARTNAKKTIGDGKVSLRVVSKFFDSNYLIPSVTNQLLKQLEYVSIRDEFITYNSRSDYFPSEDVTLAIGIGIDYLNSGNRFSKSTSIDSVVPTMREMYSRSFEQQLTAATKDPQNLFEVKGEIYSVTDKNIARYQNLQGYYLKNEYIEATDDIISTRNAIHDVLSVRKEVFKKGLKVFQSTYSKQSDHLPDIAVDKSHPNHEAYMRHRYDVLSYADYDSSRLYLINARFQIISATFMGRCRRGSQLLKVVRSSR
ncbi:hypothetical protein, partial [Vibrio agarivorans]